METLLEHPAAHPAVQNLRIVLVGTQHPGNIGSAARAMKTMGLSRLVLVAPEKAPDRDTQAMAAGADDLVEAAPVFASLAEAVADCRWVLGATARNRRIQLEPLHPRDAARRAVLATASGPVALVFGRERTGLDNDELQLCHAAVHIPSDPAFSSLNLAAAVQVLSYELRMAALGEAAAAPADVQAEPATHADFEGFMSHLERVVTASGFHDPANPKRLLPRMRRLLNRVRLEKEEVAILRGMLTTFETPKRRG